MGERVARFVTEDSFDANGTFVPAGQYGSFDVERLNGKEKHLVDPNQVPPTAVVEIAPIGPTGPNPTHPQQIPADAVQTPGGGYAIAGKTLVAEVTRSADIRLAQIEKSDEAAVSEALGEISDNSLEGQRRSATAVGAALSQNVAGGKGQTTGDANDALVEGSVADVTADLGSKTDAELTAIEAAENDREKPRKGVLSAIEDERNARIENANS